jgi:2-C-methyl-D-erythritol 2,4-cyclodiphosphate synthase
MKKRIAGVLGLPLPRVGIKATTNERLGFIGRGEGVAAMAVASISEVKK